jgi:hypothetical protein
MAIAWDAFERLEDSPERNFELLWRAIVQRNWGAYGTLRSRRNQPGVEFHLELHTDCDLGEAGRWFGWQCRWYRLNADNGFSATQKESIKEAIVKTLKHVPGVTDFILCLKELPKKSDIEWFEGLAPEEMRLVIWAEEELDTRMSGAAAIVREAYFGELILERPGLALARDRSLAPVKARWMPDLNVRTEVEAELEATLLRPGSAGVLRDHGEHLDVHLATIVGSDLRAAGEETRTALDQLCEEAKRLAELLLEITESIDERRPNQARELLAESATPQIALPEAERVARRIRWLRSPASLAVTAMIEEIDAALRSLREHRKRAESELLAVIGAPGAGKSHLSAQLTQESGETPAGVFIRASELGAGGTLDQLAAALPGLSLEGFDKLLAAVDAAGARLGARIPVVIDGLNEAERPTRWKDLLAELEPILGDFPNALLIVTVRETARAQVLIEQASEIELEWSEAEVDEAVRVYFEHFKINAGGTVLPFGYFRELLFLRLYCEAVNPEAVEAVGVEGLPGDMVAVFELYRERALERIASDHDLRPGLPAERLALIAKKLWDENQRSLPFAEMQATINEPETEWNRSLVKALEEAGILYRGGEGGWEHPPSSVVFDRFAGFLIADALIEGLSMSEAEEFLRSEDLWERLLGEEEQAHPLGADIFLALVGLVPRRFGGRNLWTFAPEVHRRMTLGQTMELASEYLDPETLDRLAEAIPDAREARARRRHPFDRLWEVRDAPRHRLNARFFDRVLRSMPLARRDRLFSEWSRTRQDSILEQIETLRQGWEARGRRDDADDLNALAISWLLTSTSQRLRDRATRALQRYGVGDPGRLFDLALGTLELDDPYVYERCLAACFGAAAEHQMPDPGGSFEQSLAHFLEALRDAFLGASATHPSSHQLLRQYVAALFELAAALHPAAMPEGVDAAALDFAPGPEPAPLGTEDELGEEADHAIYPDFSNYTVGSLYPDRSNYEFEHADYQAGMAEIRGRVRELGWGQEVFGEIDRGIAELEYRASRFQHPGRIERYGKKYSVIAFQELAGRRAEAGLLEDDFWWTGGRGVYVEIDPAFPNPVPPADVVVPTWADPGPEDPETWFCEGTIEIPDSLLRVESINGQEGPWLLVDGMLRHRPDLGGRRVFAFFRGFLIDSADAEPLVAGLAEAHDHSDRLIAASPEARGTFSGEIPWSTRFALSGSGERPGPYLERTQDLGSEGGFEIEILAHSYGEDFSREDAEGSRGAVPSHALADRLGLRKRSASLDLVGLDGRTASLTLDSPATHLGHLTYVREDLLESYGAGRSFVQVAYGEREIAFEHHDPPAWLRERGWESARWSRAAIRELGGGEQ